MCMLQVCVLVLMVIATIFIVGAWFRLRKEISNNEIMINFIKTLVHDKVRLETRIRMLEKKVFNDVEDEIED